MEVWMDGEYPYTPRVGFPERESTFDKNSGPTLIMKVKKRRRKERSKR